MENKHTLSLIKKSDCLLYYVYEKPHGRNPMIVIYQKKIMIQYFENFNLVSMQWNKITMSYLFFNVIS